LPPTPAPAPADEAARRSLAWLLLPALAACAVVVYVATRGDAPPERRFEPNSDPPTVRDAASPRIDAAGDPMDAAIADAAGDLAIVTLPADAGADRRPLRPVAPRADAGAQAIVTPPLSATTRKVTINSKPTWSNWTVDGGVVHSGVETIELTPGKHVLHFTGNPYFKADKTVTITVPDRDGFTHIETLEPLAP
jgi:hypothetical protein